MSGLEAKWKIASEPVIASVDESALLHIRLNDDQPSVIWQVPHALRAEVVVDRHLGIWLL
jgi:hypothetical protein